MKRETDKKYRYMNGNIGAVALNLPFIGGEKKNPCRARLKFGPGSHVSTPVTTRGYNARTGANTLASVVN